MNKKCFSFADKIKKYQVIMKKVLGLDILKKIPRCTQDSEIFGL